MTSARGSISFCPASAAFRHTYAAERISAATAPLMTISMRVNPPSASASGENLPLPLSLRLPRFCSANPSPSRPRPPRRRFPRRAKETSSVLVGGNSHPAVLKIEEEKEKEKDGNPKSEEENEDDVLAGELELPWMLDVGCWNLGLL